MIDITVAVFLKVMNLPSINNLSPGGELSMESPYRDLG
jgi:hypothetical protein